MILPEAILKYQKYCRELGIDPNITDEGIRELERLGRNEIPEPGLQRLGVIVFSNYEYKEVKSRLKCSECGEYGIRRCMRKPAHGLLRDGSDKNWCCGEDCLKKYFIRWRETYSVIVDKFRTVIDFEDLLRVAMDELVDMFDSCFCWHPLWASQCIDKIDCIKRHTSDCLGNREELEQFKDRMLAIMERVPCRQLVRPLVISTISNRSSSSASAEPTSQSTSTISSEPTNQQPKTEISTSVTEPTNPKEDSEPVEEISVEPTMAISGGSNDSNSSYSSPPTSEQSPKPSLPTPSLQPTLPKQSTDQSPSLVPLASTSSSVATEAVRNEIKKTLQQLPHLDLTTFAGGRYQNWEEKLTSLDNFVAVQAYQQPFSQALQEEKERMNEQSLISQSPNQSQSSSWLLVVAIASLIAIGLMAVRFRRRGKG